MTRFHASRHGPRSRGDGFTLIELAVTLAIMAMIAGAILVPMVAQISQRKIAATETILGEMKEALIGHAMATGRFPCPATTPRGDEKFATGGNATNGNCEAFVGFLPAVTLGLSPVDDDGYALDGWGTRQNRIRYAVSSQTITPPGGTAVTNPFTSTDGMRRATMGAMASANLLYVCASGAVSTDPLEHCGPGAVGSAGSASKVLTTNAPIVVWSLGANAATGGGGVDEAHNVNTDRIFVSHGTSYPGTNDFDDIVTWLSVGSLVSRMVLSGRLP